MSKKTLNVNLKPPYTMPLANAHTCAHTYVNMQAYTHEHHTQRQHDKYNKNKSHAIMYKLFHLTDFPWSKDSASLLAPFWSGS